MAVIGADLTTVLFMISIFWLGRIWVSFWGRMVVVGVVEVVALLSGLEITTLANFTPVGVMEVDLLRVTDDSKFGGTCFMFPLLMTTTLLGFIEGCSVMRRFMVSVFTIWG